MPRIISGTAGGIRLKTLEGRNTRPTSDRAKEALFSMLGDVFDGAAVLDLFSGSGSLGLEAVSRGALKAVLVENDRKCAAIIGENIKKCRFEEKTRILRSDSEKAVGILSGEGMKFDCIFMDPPYNRGFVGAIIEKLSTGDIINEEGMLVVEHSGGELPDPDGNDFRLYKSKGYGAVHFTIYIYNPGEEEK